MLQGWFIRNFRQEVHRDWMSASVLAGEVIIPDYYSKPNKYWLVRFKPRGWSWIDPAKEVAAYKSAVRSGFMTVSDVISLTSEHADAEDVFKERRRELDMMAENDLIFDTDPAQTDNKGTVQGEELVTPDGPDAQDESDTKTEGDPDSDEGDSTENQK